MRQANYRKRRSRQEWAGRIALACGAALLACQGIAFSVAQVSARTSPAFAGTLASYDGRLIAARAAARVTPDMTARERIGTEALSRDALHRDPTAVVGAVTLGLSLAADGDTAQAQRYLAYAQMLSRRNVQTQLWSIENAVAHNDIAGALRWYDITLRTKPRMSDVLYPVLVQAAHDPAIRTALVSTLAGKPLWADSYITYAAGQKDDPQSAVALFQGLRAHGVVVPEPIRAPVVNALLDTGKIDEAWRYYATLRPGADRAHVRDPHFAAMIETPSLLDWTPVNDGSITTSIQRTRDGGTFEFSAPASIGGAVLQQVQLLPPGTYRLTGHGSGIEQEARALPYWALVCRNDKRELGRIVVPNSAQANGIFQGDFTVPADCPVQILTLFVPASNAISGTAGQIDRVALTLMK